VRKILAAMRYIWHLNPLAKVIQHPPPCIISTSTDILHLYLKMSTPLCHATEFITGVRHVILFV